MVYILISTAVPWRGIFYFVVFLTTIIVSTVVAKIIPPLKRVLLHGVVFSIIVVDVGIVVYKRVVLMLIVYKAVTVHVRLFHGEVRPVNIMIDASLVEFHFVEVLNVRALLLNVGVDVLSELLVKILLEVVGGGFGGLF